MHVTYINLEHRKDRLMYIEAELKRVGIEAANMHRIDATYIPEQGALGAARSHIRGIELAQEQKWAEVLIVEDDLQWKAHVTSGVFHHQLNKMVDQEWDVLMLSVNAFLNTPHPDLTGVLRVTCGLTAAAYVVRSHYYDKLLASFRHSEEALTKTGKNEGFECLDMHWQYLQRADTWLAIQLGVQRSGYSDIMQGHVDYNSNSNAGNKF